MCQREQHGAREREHLAPPEVHVGAGEQVQADRRDDDADDHRRTRQPPADRRLDDRRDDTYSPVRNADVDGDVYCSPMVCVA